MRPSDASLLERVQGLLERTYGMRRVVLEVGRFIIGDRAYRRLYGGANEIATAGSSTVPGARTLLRETTEGLRASIYYPDVLIRCLEAHPPERGLRDANVDAFSTLVEELDHLLYVADRAAEGRPVTLFELELHANVSKYLVLARFLAGAAGRLAARHRFWLRYHLFEKGAYADEDAAVRARYRDAARFGLRFLDATTRLDVPGRLEALRRFHRIGAGAKVALIEDLAA